MRRPFTLFLVLMTLPWSTCCAGHDLERLIGEALYHNCGIRALHEGAEASRLDTLAQYGAFHPQVYLEGGTAREDLHKRKDSYQYGYLALDWNLYRGGADKAELQKLKSLQQITCLNVEEAQRSLAREVAHFYYEILYSRQALALHHLELDANRDYALSAERKWSSGLTSEVDLLEFDLREAELRGQIKLLQGDLIHAQQQLWTLIGCPDLNVELKIDGSFAKHRPYELCKLYQCALAQRPEKARACYRQQMLCKELTQSRAQGLPKVDLHATYGSEADTQDERSQGMNLFLSLSIPLWDGATAYNRQRAAKARAQQQQFASCQLDQTIYREISATLSRLNLLSECIELEEGKLRKQEEYWSKTSDEYERGVKNSPDLAAAAEQRLRTQINILELERDYAFSLITLSEAVGCYPPLNPDDEVVLGPTEIHPIVHVAPEQENHPPPRPS